MKRLTEDEATRKIAKILEAAGLDVLTGTLALVAMAGKIASECAPTEDAFRGWKRGASEMISRVPWPMPVGEAERGQHASALAGKAYWALMPATKKGRRPVSTDPKTYEVTPTHAVWIPTYPEGRKLLVLAVLDGTAYEFYSSEVYRPRADGNWYAMAWGPPDVPAFRGDRLIELHADEIEQWRAIEASCGENADGAALIDAVHNFSIYLEDAHRDRGAS